MRIIFFVFLTALLTACSTTPNLLYTEKPILNITEEAAQFVDAEVEANKAWVQNKMSYPILLGYQLSWYDKHGVTQLANWQRDEPKKELKLEAQQKVNLSLEKPTLESTNYRLYLWLN